MKTKLFLAVCLALLGITTTAQAKTFRRFTLILDFSTCVSDPNNANLVSCQEKDGSGKPVGQITVTYQGPIADDGTCATNFLCNGTRHEGHLYTLDGGTVTVATATAYQGQAPFTDETDSRLSSGSRWARSRAAQENSKTSTGHSRCAGMRTSAFASSTSSSHSWRGQAQ
jgi:hypothetical protein